MICPQSSATLEPRRLDRTVESFFSVRFRSSEDEQGKMICFRNQGNAPEITRCRHNCNPELF